MEDETMNIFINEGDQTIYQGPADQLPTDACRELTEAVQAVVGGEQSAAGTDPDGCEFVVHRDEN
jgi:hypothetical protein